jgi:hypothetical protein
MFVVRDAAAQVDTGPRAFLIYGRSGMRKTSFFKTCPKPVLLLDFDKNPQPLYGTEGITIVQFADEYNAAGKLIRMAWQSCNEYMKKELEAKWNQPGFVKPATIGLDSITTALEAMLRYSAALSGGSTSKEDIALNAGLAQDTELVMPGKADYGRIFTYVGRLIPDLKKFGAHLIVTAHEFRHQAENTGLLQAMPLLPGKAFPDRLPLYFDTCLQFCCETGLKGPLFFARTMPDGECMMAKCSFRGLPPKVYDPDFEKMMATDAEWRIQNARQTTKSDGTK